MTRWLPIAMLTLLERRKLIAWTIFASAILMVYTMSVFPSFRDTDITSFVDQLPEAMKSFFSISGNIYETGAGFLNTELFTMMVPIVVLIVGIALASGTIAGEEDVGRMDLIMSGPVTRARLYGERAVGTLAAVALVSLALVVMIPIGNVVVDLGISMSNIAAAAFMVWLYGAYYSGAAMAIAGITGSTGIARGLSCAFAIASYLVQSLSGIEPSLEHVSRYTGYHHYMAHTPLVSGIDWGDAAMLLAGSVVWFGVGLVGFLRRDLG